jgi:hypothetical protein
LRRPSSCARVAYVLGVRGRVSSVLTAPPPSTYTHRFTVHACGGLMGNAAVGMCTCKVGWHHGLPQVGKMEV